MMPSINATPAAIASSIVVNAICAEAVECVLQRADLRQRQIPIDRIDGGARRAAARTAARAGAQHSSSPSHQGRQVGEGYVGPPAMDIGT